jgi:molybdate transport system substrate-binding protein
VSRDSARASTGRSLLAGLLIAGAPHHAYADEIKVLCSNGIKAVVSEAVPQFERASGHKVVVTYGVSAVIARQIETGAAAFDVAILTADPIDAAIRSGRIRGDSRTLLARSPMALAVRAGAAKPRVDTVDSLVRALRQANAVSYAREGASAPFFKNVLRQLALTDEIAPKVRLADTGAEVGALVRRGEADLGVLPMSEILPIPGLEVLAPFPGRTQGHLLMVSGLSVTARRVPAEAFVRFLTSASLVPLLKAKGMEGPPATGVPDSVPPAFVVLNAEHEGDTRVSFVPPGIDWERAAPPELRRLQSGPPDAEMAARLRDSLDDFGHAKLPYDVAVPAEIKAKPYVLLDAAGVTPLTIEGLRGTARIAMTDPGRRDVAFFGHALARPLAAAKRLGGGFVLAGVSEKDVSISESRRQAVDLLDGRTLARAGSPRFWTIVKQYEPHIAGDSTTYVFVQWAPDDQVREAGCQFRFTLFKLAPDPVPIATTDYGCDV